ncbi:MAG: CocE/NonD family hydrolase [Halobacteriales archaeon]
MVDHTAQLRYHRDLRIPVAGETVAATRYEPTEYSTPLPALLMYIPYHKDDHITFGAYEPLIQYVAQAGYEVVVADMVGTGASTGVKSKPFSDREGDEAAQIIDWLAARDWTTDRIGMFGKSYGGITALKAAAEQPTHLEAIVPIHSPHDMYDWGCGARNFRGALGHWTSLMQALQAMPPSRRDGDGHWVDVWNERLDGLRDRDPWTFEFLARTQKDEYWNGMDVDIERIDVPTFGISGWRDGFPMATDEYIGAVDAPKRMLLGPWRHIMPHRGREAAINFREQVVEWFDHFLKDRANGATDWPPIVYWTEQAGGGTIGAGTWRGRQTWPKVTQIGTDTTTFAVSPEGLVPVSSFETGGIETEHEIDHTVGIESLDYGEPVDTNADDARSLVFETDPFDVPFELTGNGRATLRIESTIADPVLAVRVIDVRPDGSATMVTHGELRASHRHGHYDKEQLTPGEEYEISIPLKAKSHVFEPGHCMRVAVSGALFPKMLPPTEHGSLWLRSTPGAPTTVELPGTYHRSGVQFSDTVALDDPATTPPPTAERVSNEASSCQVRRNHFADSAAVVTDASHDLDLPHGDMTYSEHIEASVDATDPTSATVTRRSTITLAYASDVVEVIATSRCTRNLAHASTTVTIDGETYFDETWRMDR